MNYENYLCCWLEGPASPSLSYIQGYFVPGISGSSSSDEFMILFPLI